MKTLFAWTAPGSNYPEYVNIATDAEGMVVVSVREPSPKHGQCGQTVAARIPAAQFTLSPPPAPAPASFDEVVSAWYHSLPVNIRVALHQRHISKLLALLNPAPGPSRSNRPRRGQADAVAHTGGEVR